MTERDIICDAVLHFGVRNQVWKAIEELGELIAALGKSEVKLGVDTQVAVVDEIADASIMIDQLSIIFGEAACRDRRKVKIERLAAIMGMTPENFEGAPEC